MDFSIEDLAKYPHIPPARKWLQEKKIDLRDLSDPKYESAVARAEERIIESFRSGAVSCKLENPECEFISFFIAMALVKSARLEHIAMRWGFAEAERSRLQLELEKDEQKVVEIAKLLLGIKIDATY